ncbi:hypothetical protein HK101_011050 [Irineochytrium annulatum]|nr:hypothetical protein HK101_011050 [Irineochytrium annulatum]
MFAPRRLPLLQARLLATTNLSPTNPAWSPQVVRPYKDKPLIDLLNSYAVFKLCAFPPLVDWTPSLLRAAEVTRMKWLANGVVKGTFFKHFCGGETIKEVLPTMSSFQSRGIGSILDLAMEADLGDKSSMTPLQARQQAKHIAKLMTESIDIASEQPDSFIAAKVTAFWPPDLLLKWSVNLAALKAAYASINTNTTGVTFEEACKMKSKFPQLERATMSKLFPAQASDPNARMDWIAVSDVFTIGNPIARAALVGVKDGITEADFESTDAVMEEMKGLLAHARNKGVRVMIDAEQTYFQPAIDDVAISLSREFNPKLTSEGRAVVYNTYQMYLRGSLERLRTDLDRAERGGYCFGVKIVRGAYMVSERERAEDLNYPDPIQPDLASTHASYNGAIDLLVSRLASHPGPSTSPSQPLTFVVASHNRDSVFRAVNAMVAQGIVDDGKEGRVAFAQLMGMQDGTSYALAANGFKVYKYIPYGPIDVTIPYLLRRAQENSAVLGAVAEDRRNIGDEIRRRWPFNASTQGGGGGTRGRDGQTKAVEAA